MAKSKKLTKVADVPTKSGTCPIGIVEESLSRDNCKWESGWTIGFMNDNEVLCTEDTASNLGVPECEFMDMAAAVAGRNMYLRCYPATYDEYGEDVHCLTDLYFKSERTARRFAKRLAEYGREKVDEAKQKSKQDE